MSNIHWCTKYWWVTLICILKRALHFGSLIMRDTFHGLSNTMCLLQWSEESGTKIEARQSADKSLYFLFFSFPIRRESLITAAIPPLPPGSPCPSHLCVCTAAISKSISCHLSFLLAQFCSLHLSTRWQAPACSPFGPDNLSWLFGEYKFSLWSDSEGPPLSVEWAVTYWH